MITFGFDAHKRTHTIVAVDDRGQPVDQTTVGTTGKDHRLSRTGNRQLNAALHRIALTKLAGIQAPRP